MVRDWISEDEKMAFSQDNQRLIQDQIEASIRKALNDLNPQSRAKRTLRHLRDWGLTAMIYAVPLGLAALCVTLGIKVNSDIREEASFRTSTLDHFKTIEQSLKELGHPSQLGKNSGPSSQSPLQAFAAMDQPQFAQNLRQVSDAVSKAQLNGTVASTDTVDELQKKLATIPLDSPEAIHATASLINYASFVREKTDLFPNATAVQAQDCGFIKIGDGKSPVDRIVAEFNGATMARRGSCKFRLDGLSLKNMTFTNIILVYTGGVFKLNNVRFVNCLFLVSIPDSSTPSDSGKKFAREILVKNIGASPAFTISEGE